MTWVSEIRNTCFSSSVFQETSLFIIGIFILIALIPAAVWIAMMFRAREASKKYLGLIFFGGVLAVVPLLFLQCAGQFEERFNIEHFLTQAFTNQNGFYVALFIWVGISEEIVKQLLLRFIDRRTLLIQTVNDSIRYSLVAALGFSFAENIFYFYNIWQEGGFQTLIVPYITRSTFTAAMHMTASAIFGYYYGISKFAIDFTDQQQWQQKRHFLANLIAKLFALTKTQAYRRQLILYGLFLSMFYHGLFDFLLQLNIVLPSLLLVVGMFAYLMFLLKRKTGNLVLVTDLDANRSRLIGHNDEKVVLELLGMWFNEKRYADVIYTCERLLKRDPDNNVVKLFRAKALDRLDSASVYGKVLNTVLSDQKIQSAQDRSLLTKYLVQKATEGPKKMGQEIPVTETEEFKKFQEEEEKRKAKEETFRIKSE